MLKKLVKLLSKMFNSKEKTPGYLGRDMSKHRVHSTKYEDLCK
jgi:hypothetical protein